MDSKSGPPVPSGNGYSFPANLLLPPKSQVAQYEDAVTARVVGLQEYGRSLGMAFGIPMTDFVLNALPEPGDNSPVSYLLAGLGALAFRAERVSLDRRDGAWALYFTREPSILDRQPSRTSVPLRDAPLDVRERFLQRSEQFFRAYLKLCEDRLGSMRRAVDAADRTLSLLRAVVPA